MLNNIDAEHIVYRLHIVKNSCDVLDKNKNYAPPFFLKLNIIFCFCQVQNIIILFGNNLP